MNLDKWHQSVHLWPDPDQLRLLKLLALSKSEFSRNASTWLATQASKDCQNPNLVKLLPLVYSRVRDTQLEHPNLSRLKEIYIVAFANSAQQSRRWEQLIDAMRHEGVRPVLLKGCSLVTDYYSSLADRPMADADILVDPRQQEAANRAMLRCGWQIVRDTVNLQDARYEHSAPYQIVGNATFDVDLHFHVNSGCLAPGIDDWFLGQIESVRYRNTQSHRLKPTALMAHTLLHGFRWNEATPVRWIADATLIVQNRGAEIDWAEIIRFARQFHFVYRIAVPANFLRTEFGLPIPDLVTQTLQSHRPNWIERLECRMVLRPPAYMRTGPDRVWHHILSWALRAVRLNGGWHMPIDLIRLGFHQMGTRNFQSVGRRAVQLFLNRG